MCIHVFDILDIPDYIQSSYLMKLLHPQLPRQRISGYEGHAIGILPVAMSRDKAPSVHVPGICPAGFWQWANAT
jgi:hypothetical protein